MLDCVLRGCRALPVFACAIALGVSAAFATDAPAGGDEADAEKIDYKTLKSPVPYSEKSIARGKMLFMRQCTECHGKDGKAQIDVIADASDLTSPKTYYSGTSEGEIFRSIKKGAGVSMPPFEAKIKKDEDIWHLVNFTMSLWPKSEQPELVKADEAEKDNEAQDNTEPEADEG